MKGKRLIISLILVLLFAIAWIASITAASGVQKKKEQADIIAEADALAIKKLYVRAIPLYESALEIETDANAEIEAKLLSSYWEHGDSNDYVALAERRISEDKSSEQEILNTATILLRGSNIDEAMKLVKEGIDKFNSDSLIEFYENNAFRYKMVSARYEKIIPAENDELLAAYDGNSWHYIDSDYGWEFGESVSYDSATAYSKEGYAVVSKDGNYYTILIDGDHYGTTNERFEDIYGVSGKHILAKRNGKYSYYNFDFEPVGESYQFDEITKNSCGVAAVRKGDKWGVITDSGETVIDFDLEDVAINSLGNVFSNNVAMVKRDGKWRLINTEGEYVIEDTFSDARAPESDQYIAVADESGRWGFIDRNGKLVISNIYDDAKSFSDGLAAVMVGNRWKYISLRNNRVIDEDILNAEPFHNGKAIAYMPDGGIIIRMSYFEESKY